MKILHVITGLHTGGTELALYRLLCSMDRNKFDSRVVSLMSKGAVADQISRAGFPIDIIDMKIGNLGYKDISHLLQISSEFQPDVIQGWMYHGNLAAQTIRLLGKRKVPVFWNIRQSLHQLAQEKRSTKAVIHLCARISGLPEKIIYNSFVGAHHHQALGYRFRKTLVIPNGFDSHKFFPCPDARAEFRRELGLPQSSILIGLIARLHPVKGHDIFLAAAASLRKKYPHVHFVLAGTEVSRDNPYFLSFLEKWKLDDVVHLLGERKDVPKITAALDIATSCSYAEGFSNTLGEAMSCAVPCVTTDVGDSKVLLGDTGISTEPGNPAMLEKAWDHLLQMDTKSRSELGIAARDRIVAYYSLDRCTRQYENLYLSI